MIKKLILLMFSTEDLCKEIVERPHINTPVKMGRVTFNKVTKYIYIRQWQKD
jgi:hypothetical protein